MTDDLMTLAQIAEMHHCSLRHARDVIVKLPGFPDEAPTSTQRNRLWIRKEVRAYATSRPTKEDPKPAQIPHRRLQAA